LDREGCGVVGEEAGNFGCIWPLNWPFPSGVSLGSFTLGMFMPNLDAACCEMPMVPLSLHMLVPR
jgi:hypothetical protein